MSVEITVPELGESVVEATVGRWLKNEGDAVKVGEPVVELQTDKVDLEVGASKDGVLARIVHQSGEDVKVGDVLAVIEEGAADAAPPPDSEPASAPAAAEPPREAGKAHAAEERVTPVARRVAEEHGIDLAAVETREQGRVTKADVMRHIEAQQSPSGQTAGQPAPRTTVPVQQLVKNGDRREERIKLTRRRRTIAARLVEAQQTAAMLTTFNEIDMSAVMELRKRRKEAFQERYGIGLGLTSFFVKAAVGALRVFPQINAEISGDDMILKHYYDIGIAVGAEEGLVVPVLRDADRLSFAEIEQAINDFAQKSSSGSLSLEDLRGGTFTITNGGVFGSLLSTPILNPPQVGILGLHKIEQRPIALNGQVVIRPMMYVALTYDHRIVDGREAVQFLVRVKELVEDPGTLLLEA